MPTGYSKSLGFTQVAEVEEVEKVEEANAVTPVPETGIVIAPDTRVICRESMDQPSTEIIQTVTTPTESPAAHLRAEFDSIDKALETKVLSARKLIDDEIVPLLERMWKLLSQRGTEHVRLAAGLPTWTEYYEKFRVKFDLPSLRTFQRVLAASAQADMIENSELRKAVAELLDLIESQASGAIPEAILLKVAECRRKLNPRTDVFNERDLLIGKARVTRKRRFKTKR